MIINSNHIQNDRKGEIDYEKILENNLKDLDKQINLMSRESSILENSNKNNYLGQPFESTLYKYNNYNNYHKNRNRRKINNKPYNKKDNKNSYLSNNRFSIPHSEDKKSKYMNYYEYPSNSNINNNLAKNPSFDLTNNNTNDINRRIENLEKYY